MTIPGEKTAVEWLVSVAPDPDACRREWERNPLGVALLPAGRRWDVLILPGELGHTTLEVLDALLERPGPVLADFGDSRLGFSCPRARRPAGSGRAYGEPAGGPGSWSRTPAGPRAGSAGSWSRTGRARSPIRRYWSSRCTRRRRAPWGGEAGSLDKNIGLDHLGRRCAFPHRFPARGQAPSPHVPEAVVRPTRPARPTRAARPTVIRSVLSLLTAAALAAAGPPRHRSARRGRRRRPHPQRRLRSRPRRLELHGRQRNRRQHPGPRRHFGPQGHAGRAGQRPLLPDRHRQARLRVHPERLGAGCVRLPRRDRHRDHGPADLDADTGCLEAAEHELPYRREHHLGDRVHAGLVRPAAAVHRRRDPRRPRPRRLRTR